MKYTKKAATTRFPDVIFYGDVDIGAGAVIRAGADIREGAVIGAGAIIATVCSKYTGNISPGKDGVLIRIGCEVHTAPDWTAHGPEYAAKHDETPWWESTGKRILAFLVGEAENYLTKGETNEPHTVSV